MVIAAHPDDEVLGCGGTIAKHIAQRDHVHIVILGRGVTSRGNHKDSESDTKDLSVLAEAAQKANSILGVTSLDLLDFPDNRMDSLDRLDVIKAIEAFIEQFQPIRVYTHHAGDVNIDHRRIHEAVVTACRPAPGHSVQTLLFFEVASSTEWQPPGSAPPFMPNWFINITETLPLKLQALDAYQTEMRAWPHPRSRQSLEYLARWRGAIIGVDAAEAFMLGRNIQT